MAFRHLLEAERAGDRADNALVRRIAPGMHEHDRDSVVTLASRLRERGAHALRIRSRLNRSVGEHALVDLDDARIELLRLYDVAREDAWPRLIADLEPVAKAARGHEQRTLAAPFEQRIGGDRRSHLDGANCADWNRLARGEAQ